MPAAPATPGGGRGPRLVAAGNVNVDVLIGPLDPWPTPGTEVLADRSELRVGGALGNVALALAGLGVPARLVWDVGDDALGGWLAGAMAGGGDAPRTLRAPTSVTVGLTHPDGERTFVSHLGHLAASEPDALAAAVEACDAGDVLFVGGSFLLPRWRPELPGILSRARRRGVVTALDTGWPSEGWTDDVIAEVQEVASHVDVFLPNLEEARGLLRLPDASVGAVVTGAAELVAGRAVVKLGERGAAWCEGGRTRHVAAPATAVADTVGAGDTFDAALLAARLRGASWRAAVSAAVRVASAAVSTSPRRYPSLAEVLGGGPADGAGEAAADAQGEATADAQAEASADD